MHRLLAFLILIAGYIIVPLAVASDLIVSRAALEDVNGALSITDVAKMEFKPSGHILSKGFTNSVYWLRLQIKAPPKGSEVVLLIRQPFLNEIRLYERDAGNPPHWKTRVTGNYYPYNERDRARETLGFLVNVGAPEATLYLRLKTTTQLQMSVEALEPAAAEHEDDLFDLLEMFFVTSMVLLLLWAIHSYLLDRLPIVGLFAVHQAVYTLFGIAITGYLAPFLPAGYPRLVDLCTAIPYCAVSFTTLLFCRELFKPYDPPAVLMRGFNLFLLAFPIQIAAMAIGYTTVAVIINAILIKVTWWYFVAVTFTLRKEQSPSRRVLQIFFVTITLVFTVFWFVSSSGINIKIGRQILIANGLIIGGIFAMILNARSRRLLQEAQQSALELRAKSDFLALVSHEIRTPLNALVGFSALARSATNPVKLDQYHTILEQSARSLMELVDDILDMSKIEAGRLEVETVPFNLRQLVFSLEEQYRSLAEQKKLAFQVDVADNVPAWVLGDPVRLRQILANLLANAIKFTESGTVSCVVGVPGIARDAGAPLIRFEVKDTGIGIPENWQAQLFQPFRQLDPSITRTFGGTGLGLAIVHSLATMMGGNVAVDSREGLGSCFVVELPLKETEAVPDDPAQPMVMASGSALVVEDNAYNRRLLEDILTACGHRVTPAEDGRQALQLIEQHRFDMILLDIRMPDIDGIEVARRIRLRERGLSETPVPIIAITADADTATREACLKAGINGVLAKPVIPGQLARAIAELCGESLMVTSGEELLLNLQTNNDLGKNPERARQYREMLLADIDDELQALQTAFAGDDRNGLCHAAHTLKGLCGHLANSDPAEQAAWLQTNAQSAGYEEMRPVIEQMQATLTQENNP
ncbi:MAG: response regulator [Proteobacteria bacterium]|nr:response regulator [Pseudomonadota bacterium]